jgi:hypothetical protein
MPRLNKFTFSINTRFTIREAAVNFPSNEYIQRSFIGRGYGQVGSYVFPNAIKADWIFPARPTSDVKAGGKCQIYSIPYSFKYLFFLNNSYQGGMFVKVEYLSMSDIRPFEYQFFELIAKDFPSLKQLVIGNIEPQKNKQYPSTLITFPHLILLNLVNAHMDYIKQFLFDKITHLPCLLDLCITYESLTTVTKNFTNDATRLYCRKLKALHIDKPFVPPEHFHSYFPLL